MVIGFDNQKMNNRGENLSPKHCYAKPLDYTIFIFTAMGVYFSLLDQTWFKENKSMLLIKPRAIYGTASSRYTDCINIWVTEFCDQIYNLI